MQRKRLTNLPVIVLLALPAASQAQVPAGQSAFLKERVSIVTKSGVTGLAPGTRVEVVGHHGDKVTVKAADQQVDVSAGELTTDEQLARSLNQQDVAQQQAYQNQIADTEARIHEARINQQKVEAQNSAEPNDVRSKLEEINRRRTVLNLELERIHFEQKDMPPPNSTQYYSDRHGRRQIKSIGTSPNSFAMEQRRKAVERELLSLKEQEALLRLQPSPTQPRAAQLPTVTEKPVPVLSIAPTANGLTNTTNELRPVPVVAPKPDYPYEARTRHITGSGIVELTVDPGSGAVTDAKMAQSIGNPILDNSALSAFRRWQFRPGAYSSKMRFPIKFTSSGASY